MQLLLLYPLLVSHILAGTPTRMYTFLQKWFTSSPGSPPVALQSECNKSASFGGRSQYCLGLSETAGRHDAQHKEGLGMTIVRSMKHSIWSADIHELP